MKYISHNKKNSCRFWLHPSHTHTLLLSPFMQTVVLLMCTFCSRTTISLCASLIRDGHSSTSQIIDPPSEIVSVHLTPHHSTSPPAWSQWSECCWNRTNRLRMAKATVFWRCLQRIDKPVWRVELSNPNAEMCVYLSYLTACGLFCDGFALWLCLTSHISR